MKVLKYGQQWARIRATKKEVGYARPQRWSNGKMGPEPLDMSGNENYLSSGAKAYYRGGGVWLISGYYPDSSDVLKAIFKIRWEGTR